MTEVNISLNNIGLGSELISVVITINMPMIPKAIDENINTRVAIFCIGILYNKKPTASRGFLFSGVMR